MKMEKNKTTTYMTAKTRMGWRAPIVADFLAFIIRGFDFTKNIGLMYFGPQPDKLCCGNKNIS